MQTYGNLLFNGNSTKNSNNSLHPRLFESDANISEKIKNNLELSSSKNSETNYKNQIQKLKIDLVQNKKKKNDQKKKHFF